MGGALGSPHLESYYLGMSKFCSRYTSYVLLVHHVACAIPIFQPTDDLQPNGFKGTHVDQQIQEL